MELQIGDSFRMKGRGNERWVITEVRPSGNYAARSLVSGKTNLWNNDWTWVSMNRDRSEMNAIDPLSIVKRGEPLTTEAKAVAAAELDQYLSWDYT